MSQVRLFSLRVVLIAAFLVIAQDARAALQAICPQQTGGQVSVPYSAPVGVAGGVGPYTFTLNSGSLPPGLTLNPSTGVISGTPTTAGAYSFSVQVMSASEEVATTPGCGITISTSEVMTARCVTATGGTVGAPYSSSIGVTGGTAPYTFTLNSGSLPPGLMLNPSTGVISGTPTMAGTYSFSVRVGALEAEATTPSCGITISTSGVGMTAQCVTATGGIVGTPYSSAIGVTGGTAPYTFTLSSGSLPPGLMLNPSTGAISGTPTTVGGYSFSVRVTSASETVATTPSCGITISTSLGMMAECVPATSGIVGAPYGSAIGVIGGTAPYTFTLNSGSLPPGLTLNPSTGAISGTPTTVGPYSFSVRVTSASMAVATTPSCGITILPGLGMTAQCMTATSGTIGAPYSSAIRVIGGTAPFSFTLNSGALPPGLTLNPSTGTISGTPATAGPYSFSVRVSSASEEVATTPSCGIFVTPSSTPPQPSLSIGSLKPARRVAGGPTFTLTVNGSGFQTVAVVEWNAEPLLTTYLNSTQLQAVVPAGLINTPGLAAITVVAGSDSSAAVGFRIAVPPVIQSIDPENIASGGPDLSIAVIGTDFAEEAIVLWNGDPLSTTYVTPTLLRATVPALRIAVDGKAAIRLILDEVASNTVEVTMLTPVIKSLGPEVVTAGGPAFMLTINGSGFARGAVVQWNGETLTTTVVSLNQLTATVPAPTITTAGVARITVSFQTATSNSSNLNVLPSLTSLSPASVIAGGPAVTLTVTGTGFANSSIVSWNQTALETAFVDSTRLTASVPASLSSAPVTVEVTVASSELTSNGLQFRVVSLAVPAITITGLQPTPVPTQDARVGIELAAPADLPLDGTLTLSFRPAAGLPAGARDPFLQFASGGTTLNFTVPPGSTIATLPQNGVIQQGTIAGEIIVTITRLVSGSFDVLPQPAPSRTLVVAKIAPVITPNSVRITNMTSSSLDVEGTAYSTTLDIFTATYAFEIASGIRVTGSATVPVDVRTPADQWYATSQYGSLVRLRVRFPIEGDPNSVQRVTLTLTNSVGTSVPVSGGK